MGTIIVVGSGIAGDEAAHAACRTDPEAKVIMITGESHPLYSACVLADYVAGHISRDRVFLRTTGEYAGSGIDIQLSQRVIDWFPDQRMLRLKDRELGYDSLILATGSQALIPPLHGAGKKGVITLKTIGDADLIKEKQGGTHAVIVGSGPVGIEASLALRHLGWKVWIVELLERVLPRLFDAPIAALIKAELEERGIRVRPGERLMEILGEDHVEGVRTDRRTLKADLVLLVIGMKPEVSLAKKGGLALGPAGGIEVNEYMVSTRPDVWACGDCVESRDRLTGRTGLFMLWNNARLQGRAAGINAAGGACKYRGSLNITTVNLINQAAASVGFLAGDLPEGESQSLTRYGPSSAFNLIMRKGKIVGAQALGHTERVGGLLGLLLRGGDLRDRLMGKYSSSRLESWPLRGLENEITQILAVDGKGYG